jgi:hypothetical protein
MENPIEVDLASPEYEEKLVARLTVQCGDRWEQFAEIAQRDGYLKIEVFRRRDPDVCWEFRLSELSEALQKAQRGLGRTVAAGNRKQAGRRSMSDDVSDLRRATEYARANSEQTSENGYALATRPLRIQRWLTACC